MAVIGIDLGTTQSCIGIFRDGQVEIIPNDQGNRTTPSCVAFVGSDRFIGENAKNLEVTCPKNTIFDMKRLIGRKFSDPSVQADIEHWPFTVVNQNDQPRVIVHLNEEAKTYAPEEVSAMVLAKLKESAEAYLGTTVNDAVITVPAYFNDSQRRATQEAGRIAGLNVLRIINEPTAAALAYSMEKKPSGEHNIMVFDVGGGTFDVSILTVEDNVIFEVRSTAGDTHLGGEDFDLRMVDYFAEEFWRKYGRNLKSCPRSLRRLKKSCEAAKRCLSTNMEATIEIDSLFEKIDFSSKISRARFEDLCIDLFRSTIKLVERALEDARMTKDDIDQLILVGGSTRIPKIRKLLEEFMKDVKVSSDIHPDEAVAYGAALKAAIISGQSKESFGQIALIDVVPASLGIETAGHQMTKFIHRNTRIPTRITKEFTTFYEDQRSAIIRVFEGEEELTNDNSFLGEFELTLPPAPMGKVHIAVIFELDVNGILNVEAVDQNTGLSTHITIQSGQLPREMDTMLTEVDEPRRRESDCVYGAARERLLSARWLVSEYKHVLTVTERRDVLETCQRTMEWLDEYSSCIMEEYEIRRRELGRVMAPLMIKLPCSVAMSLRPDDLLAGIWEETDFDRNN